MDKYIFREYDPIYPRLFSREKVRLDSYLKLEVVIEHFGSTAVPGLGGKGIIDIYVGVPQNMIDETKLKIQEAGYELRPGVGTSERFFFRRIVGNHAGGEQRYHVHLTYLGSHEFKRDIAFRDYLRSHTEDRDKYAEIKREAANKAQGDKDIYMAIKEPVIQAVVAKLAEK